jgi:hypothetical protein
MKRSADDRAVGTIGASGGVVLDSAVHETRGSSVCPLGQLCKPFVAGCSTISFQQVVHMQNPWSISKIYEPH